MESSLLRQSGRTEGGTDNIELSEYEIFINIKKKKNITQNLPNRQTWRMHGLRLAQTKAQTSRLKRG
jgi:hypothetical protein